MHSSDPALLTVAWAAVPGLAGDTIVVLTSLAEQAAVRLLDRMHGEVGRS